MEKEVKDMLNNAGKQDKNEAEIRSQKMRAIDFATDDRQSNERQAIQQQKILALAKNYFYDREQN